MNQTSERQTDSVGTRSARDWTTVLMRYRRPSNRRAILEIGMTVPPLVGLWVLLWASLDLGYWITLLLALPAAGFLVRLFMIQHDCGHGSFFRSRIANDLFGRVSGVLTVTPYDYWRRTHALHHAGSGNLDRRGFGEVATLTVAEYRARSWWGRLRYRLFRHPLILFVLGPAYLFIIQHRLPIGLMREGWRPWASAMGTNLGIALVIGTVVWFTGIEAFLLVHVPIMLIAATIGVWLFYVQHQFERTVWEREGDWSWHEAALHGSSHYDLPGPLRWFTANIGLHHVHHLSSRIPYYRLPKVVENHPELRDVSRLTLLDSLRCVRLVLWNEDERRLVSFREARLSA